MTQGGADPSVRGDLEAQYVAAKRLVSQLEQAWEEHDPPRPLLTEGGATGSAIVPHPLVKMIQEARRDVDRFAKALLPVHRGARPKAVVSARVGKSPDAKLRRVK